MNWQGIIIGLVSFLIIGGFHPIVIKSEYYFGVRCWWIFLLVGIASLIGSLFVRSNMLAASVGVFGFSCLWCILEVFEQRERVKKGWFPAGPSHK